MRISTLAPAIESVIGDSTCGDFFFGSQKFYEMLTDIPFPILHQHPLSSTSLSCNMLVHVWEPACEFLASIIEQVGEKQALKTL